VRWLLLLIRIAIGALFVYAGAVKLAAPLEMAEAMERFRILPEIAVIPAARLLPVLECLAGLSLVFGLLQRGGALLGALMSAAFGLAVALALARKLNIDCGCLGAGTDRVGYLHLAGNVIILAACLALLFKADGLAAVDSKLPVLIDWLGVSEGASNI